MQDKDFVIMRAREIGRDEVFKKVKFATVRNEAKFAYQGKVMKMVAKELQAPKSVVTLKWWASLVPHVKKGLLAGKNQLRNTLRERVRGEYSS